MNESNFRSGKTYKAILIGPECVGKSSILYRLTTAQCQENYTPTLGVDFKSYSLDLDTQKITIQIWDTAGQERFKALTRSYFKGSHCCVCVYDVNNEESVKRCEGFIKMAIEEGIPEEYMLLLANKSDLGNAFEEQGKELASKYNMKFSIVSAKNGIGLLNAFNNLMVALHKSNLIGLESSKNLELMPSITVEHNEPKCKC